MQIKCSDGKNRAALTKRCICGKEYITEKRRPKNFCSRKCRMDSVRVELICCTCQSVFSRQRSKLNSAKHGYYFCSRKCKEKAQSIEGGLKDIQPSHYGSGISCYREKFTKEELVCNRCGYNEFPSSVDIHHIDHNRNNNHKSNLLPLCANCHMALHHKEWEL